MCRIKDVKEIFHARALLVIVSKHQGKDENHEPLGSSDASAFKHLYTELADTEEDIHNAEQIFLLLQEIAYFYIFFIDNQIFAIIEELIESIDKMHETNYFFVTYGDITGSFVSYVYFVLLFYQTAKRTTH